MPSLAVLLHDVPRRVGFRARPAVLRATIPAGIPGTYMLLHDQKTFYVGRSDTSILDRLCGHELLPQASHVVWEPCSGPEQAYHLEAAWFHALTLAGSLTNKVHPAKPGGYTKNCPYCEIGDSGALYRALPHLRKQ
jgi:hypothetical protein